MSWRTDLRDAAVAALQPLCLAGGALADFMIETSRPNDLKQEQLPALLVYAAMQHGEPDAERGAPLVYWKSSTTIHVVARVAATDRASVETMLDAAVDAAKVALLSSPAFTGGGTEGLTRFEIVLKYDGRGEQILGEATMAFDAETHEAFPQAIPDLFVTMANTVEPAGVATPIQQTITLA
ncbi:MAG: hypothetical protein KGN77_01815 [Xanthomonadaceae bacterium]|nr:hypothetical protein [Xanthomonadaceae bacterium]